MFLGTAQKKVGDVVLYRRDGVQQSRVRVRNIANPKTEGQALQRCFLAPVAKFYAPLAGVLERSWENQTKARSAQAFQRVNISKAKSGGWFVPKGTGFFPLPYQLSYGILPRLKYTIGAASFSLDAGTFTGRTIGAFSQGMIARYGLAEGDQVTCIVIMHNESTGTYRPMWLRFLLNTSDSREGSALTSEFRIDISSGLLIATSVTSEKLVAGAFIVSRYDDGWKRSTQSLLVLPSVLSLVTGEDARAAAIASYQDASSVVTSDVYLNGSVGAPSQESLVSAAFNIWENTGYGTISRSDITAAPLSLAAKTFGGVNDIVVAACVGIDGAAFTDVVLFKRRSDGSAVPTIVTYLLKSDGTWSDINPATSYLGFNLDDIPSSLVEWYVSHGIPASAFL